jgi:hypothetical protein
LPKAVDSEVLEVGSEERTLLSGSSRTNSSQFLQKQTWIWEELFFPETQSAVLGSPREHCTHVALSPHRPGFSPGPEAALLSAPAPRLGRSPLLPWSSSTTAGRPGWSPAHFSPRPASLSWENSGQVPPGPVMKQRWGRPAGWGDRPWGGQAMRGGWWGAVICGAGQWGCPGGEAENPMLQQGVSLGEIPTPRALTGCHPEPATHF